MYPIPYHELSGWNIKSLSCGSSTFACAATYANEKSTITWGHSNGYRWAGGGDDGLSGSKVGIVRGGCVGMHAYYLPSTRCPAICHPATLQQARVQYPACRSTDASATPRPTPQCLPTDTCCARSFVRTLQRAGLRPQRQEELRQP